MSTTVHTLSKKSVRQRRNVFIWCGNTGKLSMGWRVDSSLPVTISTSYRWVTIAVKDEFPEWPKAQSYALFPIGMRPSEVLSYYIYRHGPALSRESQEPITPGDYGIFTIDGSRPEMCYIFTSPRSYFESRREKEKNSPALASKTLLPSSLARQALDRDDRCIFSGVSFTDTFGVTWIFPPFEGYTLSKDTWLEWRYRDKPDTIDFSEFMVVTNVISGRNDIITLFWENKLGVDVDDNYRIINFEVPESLSSDAAPLKTHLTLCDGPHRPSDRFLRMHFERCVAVSAYGGDVRDDYGQEINMFMDDLGVYDDEIDYSDPRWMTSLGMEVHSYLIRQRLAPYAEEEERQL